MQDIQPQHETIASALSEICASPFFARSKRLKKFLSFVTNFYLNNPKKKLSSIAIATDCYNRDLSKDPNDAYVRNVASQVRSALKSYYASLKQPPEIVIQLADKGYDIVFLSPEEPAKPNIGIEEHSTAIALPTSRLLPTIAVLPFQCLGGDKLHSVIGNLLAGSLTSSLAQSKFLHVLSSRTTSQFEASSLSTRQLGESLNADYIAEGRFYVQGDTIRLQIELSSCDYDEVIWADQFRSKVDAVVQQNDELSDQVLNGVSQQLLQHELQRALCTPLQSLKCHSLLIGGINTMHRGSKSDLRKAKDMLVELQKRNPQHASPLAHLAYWGVIEHAGNGSKHPSESVRDFVLEHVDRALEIDSRHPIALTAEGVIRSHFDGDFVNARTSYEKAILHSPNETAALGRLAVAQLYTDTSCNALATARDAIKLSPADPELHFYQAVAAIAAFGQGQYQDAILSAEASYDIFPNQLANLRTLISSYTAIDDQKSAEKYKQHLLNMEPSFNLKDYQESFPFPHQAIIQRLTLMLKKSGLPSCA